MFYARLKFTKLCFVLELLLFVAVVGKRSLSHYHLKAWWLSGRVLGWRSKGRKFETHRRTRTGYTQGDRKLTWNC